MRDNEALSTNERIRRFRKRCAASAVTIGILAGTNAIFTPFFPWVLFPAVGMSIGLLHHGASLWADGIRLRDIFGARNALAEGVENKDRGGGSQRPLRRAELALKLAPADVLNGPYGDSVRRAADDREATHSALAKLSKPDRELIPDVGPTADALADRVGSLALALHRLDSDVDPDSLASLDVRISHARSQSESPDREKKLALLERQRATVADLMGRRETLRSQLESASLMLQNLRLDLLALGNAGVQAALNDVSSATQEARALSREIQNALAAAREIR
jgi:serine/threonine-protein kinase